MVSSLKDPWRLKFHLMPPGGWLNDPNGLCQFQGIYHIFFQYHPESAAAGGGGPKVWGHYAGPSLTDLQFQGIPFPQSELDRDGSYSGSALIAEGAIQLFYTGNIRHAGDYDYIHDGRESNTIRIVSEDGKHYGEKQLLLTTSDYPHICTRHVRDPKVWKQGTDYWMVLGARQQNEQGSTLLYQSADARHWQFYKILTTPEPFGYMWECPDYFEDGGQAFLSLCPQGLPSESLRFQNIYQAGYFRVTGALEEEQRLEDFHEWDMGFDFYAPQTFQDERGRRLLVAWAGLPDAPYSNPTEALGWQHTLTLPRQLSRRGGILLQTPADEFSGLRFGETPLRDGDTFIVEDGSADVELAFAEQSPWQIALGDGLLLSWREGIVQLELSDSWGCGRTVRRLPLDSCRNLRLLIDTSMAEIFLNDGESVLTARFYPDYQSGGGRRLPLALRCPGAVGTGWQLNPLPVNTCFH